MKSTRLQKYGWQLGIILLILLYYYFQWRDINSFVQAVDHCDILFCDFKKVFYVMGKNILTKQVPVKGFYYSPFSAILFRTLGIQSKNTAVFIWGMIQVTGVILLFAVWFRSKQKANFSFKLFYLFLLLTSFPVLHNFNWGQVSIFITLAVFLTMEAYLSKRIFWAAFWLAFATSIKFYPIIFLLYFIFERDIKFLIAFAVFGFLLGVAIPVAFIGVNSTVHFYITILQNSEARFMNVADRLEVINSQYVTLVILRLTEGITSGVWMRLVEIVGKLLLGLNILLTFLVVILAPAHRTRWGFLLLFVSIPFFVPSSWPHYFVYLPAFQAFTAYMIKRDKGRYWKYALLFISIFLSNVVLFNIIGNRHLYAGKGFLFWSNLLLIILAYVELIPKLKLPESVRKYYPLETR